MTPAKSTNLVTAFDMLLEELQAEIRRLNSAGSSAFEAGEHARAQQLLARVQKLTALQSELTAWGRKLRHVTVAQSTRTPQGSTRPLREPAPRGAKTPQEAYRLPILRTLVAMGGKAQSGAVLDRVFQIVRHQLNKYDLEKLASGRSLRWRNTAEWCRNTMRQEGLISANSPRGVWEITDEGRRWLAAHDRDAHL